MLVIFNIRELPWGQIVRSYIKASNVGKGKKDQVGQ